MLSTIKRARMDKNWLTIEVTEKGHKVLIKCAEEAEGEIVIPQGVKCIGFHAFDSCENVTSVIMPDGLTTIENWAFVDCKRLDSIIITESVETIKEDAFQKYYGRIVFPSTIKRINKYAWNQVNRLYVLDLDFQGAIPDTNDAFESCQIGLLRVNMPRKSVNLPEDIKKALRSCQRFFDLQPGGYHLSIDVIYSSPKPCEEPSLVPGYIKVTKAYRDNGFGNDTDELIDINTKYIVSVEPVDINRYHPVKGSIIRCTQNASERPCEYMVYEPCDMVLQKIDASLRMLRE